MLTQLRRPAHGRWPASYQAVFALTALAIAGYYFVSVRAFNGRFEWHRDKPGFYDLLGRAFAEGHLSLPLQPKPELLALPDPWDPARNAPYRVLDLALYNGRYYLYHGAAPALLLFAPYQVLSHHDMPETFAVYLFCLLGYLSCCGILMRLWLSTGSRPGLFSFAALLLLMGICNSAPYLLQRVMAYEVALAGGYFFVSAAFYFLALRLTRASRPMLSLALAGWMFGLAIGCRPHLALAGLLAAATLLWCIHEERQSSAAVAGHHFLAFMLPLVGCSLLLAGYNYARFDDPFEFGVRYLMAPADYFRFSPSFRNLGPGLYYLLASPPDFERVFPFIRLVRHTAFPLDRLFSLPRYYLEPIAGVFAIWPLSVVALAAPAIAARWRNRTVTALVAAMCLFAVASIVFVATLGFATHRYHADWLPSLVLLTCFVLGVAGVRARGSASVRPLQRGVAAVVVAICAATLLYSVVANVAIAFQGPFDSFVQFHPAEYVKLARWFSPVARFRPLLDPPLTVEAAYEFPAKVVPWGMPLVAAGRFGSRYILAAEMLGGTRLRLTSATSQVLGSVVSVETDAIPDAPNHLRLDYRPEDRAVTVHWNGAIVLRHEIPFLVTAPAQVTIGEDRAGTEAQPSYFFGRVSGANIVIERE
jgi:hypothetical protein